MSEGLELAKRALENRQRIDALHKEIRKAREATETETRRLLYDDYGPKIRTLEAERDAALSEVRKAGGEAVEVKEAIITTLSEPVHQVQRILEFLRLDTKQDLNITDEEVKQPERYGKAYRENLGLVLDDPYLKVRLFILQNDKPVNKYMLALIGKCLFDNGLGDRPLLKLGDHYSLSLASPYASAPQCILRESASAKDLQTWWESHGLSKVPWLKDYLAVKAEYEHILAHYQVKDFHEFLTQTCPQCGYFNTIFESYYLRRGEVMTCPRDKTPMVEVAHEV